MRALVIEDDIHTVRLISELLTALRFDCVHTDNLVEAMSVLEQDAEIGLVTLDVFLPGLQGTKLLQFLHERFPHIKVLLVSAHVADLAADNDPLIAALPKLAKPFRQSDFREAIQALGLSSSTSRSGSAR